MSSLFKIGNGKCGHANVGKQIKCNPISNAPNLVKEN